MINSLFRRFIKILDFNGFIFLFRSSKLSQLYHHKDPPKSSQGGTLCFQLLFPSVWSFFCLTEFFMKVLHNGSSRIYIPSPSVHWDSFLRSSSILHLAIQSAFFLPYHWRWYYVILDNLSSCSMIHMWLRMRYFKPINLVIGVILGYSSPKAFPKECCYLSMVLINDPSSSFILPVK